MAAKNWTIDMNHPNRQPQQHWMPTDRSDPGP